MAETKIDEQETLKRCRWVLSIMSESRSLARWSGVTAVRLCGVAGFQVRLEAGNNPIWETVGQSTSGLWLFTRSPLSRLCIKRIFVFLDIIILYYTYLEFYVLYKLFGHDFSSKAT